MREPGNGDEPADDLDAVSARELHDRAIRLAVHRHDPHFLWQVLRSVPAAEAASGHVDYAEQDVSHLSALLTDLIGAGGGEAAEALRPMYLDYLREHGG